MADFPKVFVAQLRDMIYPKSYVHRLKRNMLVYTKADLLERNGEKGAKKSYEDFVCIFSYGM